MGAGAMRSWPVDAVQAVETFESQNFVQSTPGVIIQPAVLMTAWFQPYDSQLGHVNTFIHSADCVDNVF